MLRFCSDHCHRLYSIGLKRSFFAINSTRLLAATQVRQNRTAAMKIADRLLEPAPTNHVGTPLPAHVKHTRLICWHPGFRLQNHDLTNKPGPGTRYVIPRKYHVML